MPCLVSRSLLPSQVPSRLSFLAYKLKIQAWLPHAPIFNANQNYTRQPGEIKSVFYSKHRLKVSWFNIASHHSHNQSSCVRKSQMYITPVATIVRCKFGMSCKRQPGYREWMWPGCRTRRSSTQIKTTRGNREKLSPFFIQNID
jgi:hypothetical protein